MIENINSLPFKQFSKTLPVLKSGTLEARLASTEEEVRAAQALRYEVFYEECGAQPDPEMALSKRDSSLIDDFCDVLLVIDHAKNKIVGTYRFMLREAAEQYGDYYTSTEFEISKITSFPGQVMELGRSCVQKEYRTKPTMQLLWRGIGAYIQRNNVNLCFGCASFIGTDIQKYSQALAYLYHNHLAPPELRVHALANHYQDMNLIPKDKIDKKEAMRQLPPLIKGYLRLGAFVGEGAFIDQSFNSLDVCIIVMRETVTGRYSNKYVSPPFGEDV
ncbi:MAG: GNAT family N-acetyltransferase [Alphaproteobacteria bacterium]|nr:GNAT family N-acetyltransferase [Alphaproteobacteria bacterium]